MKKATWIFTLGVLVVVMLFTGCGKKDATPTGKPQPVPKQTLASAQFESAGKCQYCHIDIYRQWRGSTHALAFENPAYQSVLKQTSRETNGEADAFCVSCHAPIGWLAEEVPPVDGSGLSEVSRQGVTCDLCHTITELTGLGNASFRVTPGNTKFGPLDDAINTPLHQSEFNRLFTQSEICGSCHQIVHPQNGLVLSATYDEWKESSFGSRRINCQDCHMTPGPGVTKPNPGVAATGAPKKREHTWTHYMTGNNVFAMRQAGFEGHAAKAEENLKAAAALFLGVPEKLSPYQPARINVRVRNDGAGHYLPTGLSLYKDMWLEVIVTNEQGNVVFRSGTLDSNGLIQENSVIYKKVFGDANGNETKNLWEAAKVLRDHRIPPQEYADEFIEIPGLPLPGTLNIQVRLLYRNITPDRAKDLGISVSGIPVIEMASISGKIPVR